MVKYNVKYNPWDSILKDLKTDDINRHEKAKKDVKQQDNKQNEKNKAKKNKNNKKDIEPIIKNPIIEEINHEADITNDDLLKDN